MLSATKVPYRATEALRDGRTLEIRDLRPEDRSILQSEFQHLSKASIYFRFFTVKKSLLPKELTYLTGIDFSHHVALLASVVEPGGAEVPAGIGRYIVCDEIPTPHCAELAFEVFEEFQGFGIATLLLQHLTTIARNAGLTMFLAVVLCDNHKMMDVFRHSGCPMTERLKGQGIVEVRLQI